MRNQIKQTIKQNLPKAVESTRTIAKSISLPLLSKPSSKSSEQSRETHDINGVNNVFTKILKATNFLPSNVQATILTQTFSRIVPYVGTTGIFYDSVTPNRVVVSLNNKRRVQNHIGSIHAVAITLLAETATGFIVAVNMPSDKVIVVKSYSVNFYRPITKGQIAAIATLSDEQRQYILDTPKGEMIIPCIIDDRESDSKKDPITVEMTWAWFSKSELKARRTSATKTS